MKVAIYSPYLDTFGGGEKYIMTIAWIFSKADFDVDVLLDKHLESLGGKYLKDELSQRFDLDLEKIEFTNGPLGGESNFFLRLFFLKRYDLLFYLTDGSIFYPSAKRNIVHIQSPIIGQPAKNFWGKIKLKKWDLILYNSNFTKEYSKKNWPIDSEVIYPPIDVNKIKPLKKKKYILSVGRFFGYLRDKKQEILINTFKKIYEGGKINDWSLHLAGSTGEGDKSYLNELRSLAKGLPVKFYPNLMYDDLMRLYGETSIYWHAAGFGEEEPTKMEHFGISTVEAMAGGAVPVVIDRGGQTEIVEDGKCGYLWDSLNNLEEFTLRLIADGNLMEKISRNAIKRARDFSTDKFESKILALKRLVDK